jgi:hypothetical protein
MFLNADEDDCVVEQFSIIRLLTSSVLPESRSESGLKGPLKSGFFICFYLMRVL